jgi:hypothetical protein
MPAPVAPSPSVHRRVLVGLAAWFVLALVVSASGTVAAVVPRVPPPVFVGGLAALALAAMFAVPALRAWAAAVPLRALVGYHAVRFVGIAFLVLAARGALAPEWAVPAGWGDVAVAALALVVAAVACPPATRGRRLAVLAWNAFGLLDILFVLGSGARLALADPDALEPLTRLPLALLPTFVVPLILVTHVLIFWRLFRERPAD